MITASEPLEFIPRGRQAVEEHPGPSVVTSYQTNVPSTDNFILHRLQSFSISSDENQKEQWHIQEIYRDIGEIKPKSSSSNCNRSSSPNFFHEFEANTEDELYFKGQTAVWSKGPQSDDHVQPRICFTCETPIKYAFFCPTTFFRTEQKYGKYSKKKDIPEDNKECIGICLIDSTSLRVYCNDGEDYLTSLEFPVSKVWTYKFGILLEKEASSTTIESHSISMPRLYSLTHPLDEMSPVLVKSFSGCIGYLTEADYKVIFTCQETDFVLLFDNKIGKHFVCKLRKATTEEITYVAASNETNVSGLHSTHQGIPISSMHKTLCNSKQNISIGGRSTTVHSPLFVTKHHHSGSLNASLTRSITQSPLMRLQSSLGHSMSMQDVRRMDQTQPSKPITPEYCLEYLWTEPLNLKEFPETASFGFLHTDLIGQLYLCYLLPKIGKLNLVRLERTNDSATQIFGMISVIIAKDAVCLNKMNMIAVLAPCGTLMLYSGPVNIGKVHVGGILSSFVTSDNLGLSNFPRRSSLLPTAPPESKIEDDLHMLSPVHPLHHGIFSSKSSGYCIGLRDPAGNRLTLVYQGEKMFRISLPLICECTIVSKCLLTLRQVLQKDLAMQILIKWYGARNVPGSQDFTPQREWQLFKTVLLDLLGRSASKAELFSDMRTNPPSEEPKKRKINDNCEGSDGDWNFLMNSRYRRQNKKRKFFGDNSAMKNISRNDSSAILFPHIPLVLFSLHLLYEELKLDSSMQQYLELLAEFLYELSMDLNLENYCLHYFLDFPHFAQKHSSSHLTESEVRKLTNWHYLTGDVPNIFKHIYEIVRCKTISPFPIVTNINQMSKNLVRIISLIYQGNKNVELSVKKIVPSGSRAEPEVLKQRVQKDPQMSSNEQLIEELLLVGMTRQRIQQLPPAINFIINQMLEQYRSSSPVGCSAAAYELILRPELEAHACFVKNGLNVSENEIRYGNLVKENSLSPRLAPTPDVVSKSECVIDDDGMEHIDTKLLRLRFPDDLRIHEVRRLLNSTTPVIIEIVQGPTVTDHDFIEEQEKQLFALCKRTMALPPGRGMFTLRTCVPSSTESLPVPKLCLTGKEILKGATVEMQQIEVPPNMNLWPLFHNGVAAGLRISPESEDIDSTWIVYNKPKGTADISTEHAGFLMALGLNGHLKSLSFMSIYDYLVKCDEMTSIGLLLGISATHRGTMDTTTTKLLSVHVEALLPPTALELDIHQNIQVAAIMGIGLVYQGTAKRHIAEVLLQEIGRPPGPEMENCVERESYALTAGLSLGLVTLGQGETPTGLKDLQLPDTLHYYMVGGNKRTLVGAQKEKYKLPSFQIREGDTVNIDVTAPGATLALGLMFFKTGNQAVAEWMKPPDTKYLLDFVRPDLLLLRVISKGLILWDDIRPTEAWLKYQFPVSLEFDLKKGPADDSGDIDHEAYCQAYCNIITGAAICIGLRYSGTEDPVAYATLKNIISLFLSMSGQYIGEYAGKATVESCLIMIVLSLSLVFAGSGNLNILRIIRSLRSRIGPTNSHVTYGSHMAIHMSLGFLFLGAGRYTLSRTPEAIAALICSLFPKFPIHSNDNRYHLQAFRHLYVLAVEPRLFLPRDIDTGQLSLCQLSCIKIDSNEVVQLPLAPCMLPELDSLKAVMINDPYYWSVCFEKNRNWDQLEKILQTCGCVDVKKRAGCLSHLDDPYRLKSLLAKTLTNEQFSSWQIKPQTLLSFSNDPFVADFVGKFFLDWQIESDTMECELRQMLMAQFYNCLTQDRLEALPIFIALTMIVRNIDKSTNIQGLWQVKIISSVMEKLKNYKIECLLCTEILASLNLKLMSSIENWGQDLSGLMKQYLFSSNISFLQDSNISIRTLNRLAALIVFYDLPINILNFVDLRGQLNYLGMLVEFKKLNLETHTILYISKILNSSI